MSAAIRPAVKKIALSLDENQNGISINRRPSPDYMPTERTSTASFKAPSIGKRKPKPVEPESPRGLSAALGYISSPVRYLTSVFTNPPDQQKSPPKSRSESKKMAKTLEMKSAQPAEIVPLPEVESAPAVLVDKPPEGNTMNTEPLEPNVEKQLDYVPKVAVKEKKHGTSDNKKGSEPKRSNSQLMKPLSKNRITFSSRNYRENKRQSPSPTVRVPQISPRILSASSIKFASNNNRSYRVTSTEKEEASKSKKSGKRMFKIDIGKSPANSSKTQSSAPPAEKREEPPYSYVPLNAIEISRL